MYIPAAFRESHPKALHELIRAYSFGTLVSVVDGELFATHMPFLLDAERGPHGTLVGHLARPNPHWHSFGASALAIFQGPHAYVSPSWYVTDQAVPTWNYTAVHAYGVPSLVETPGRVREILSATVATFDTAWTLDGLSEDYIANMARGIVAFEMPVARLEGKRKLSQNRPPADVDGAIAGLRATAEPLGLAVAELMQATERRDQAIHR
jgi:transcriptional regulator